MFISNPQRFWRNFLWVAAGVHFIIALVRGYMPWLIVLSPALALTTTLVIIGSLFAALGIRQFAGIYFHMENKLWYAGFRPVCFIMLALVGLNIVTMVSMSLFLSHLVFRAIPAGQLMYLIGGFTILWITFLDRPEGIGSFRQIYWPCLRRRVFPLLVDMLKLMEMSLIWVGRVIIKALRLAGILLILLGRALIRIIKWIFTKPSNYEYGTTSPSASTFPPCPEYTSANYSNEYPTSLKESPSIEKTRPGWSIRSIWNKLNNKISHNSLVHPFTKNRRRINTRD